MFNQFNFIRTKRVLHFESETVTLAPLLFNGNVRR